VWARSTEQRHLLDPGDMQQALRAAAAIGDDRLQRMAHKRVQPETWTHGSSSERTSWLERGYERGTIEACDTFAVGADGPRREGTR
jgi:predicted metalloprotease